MCHENPYDTPYDTLGVKLNQCLCGRWVFEKVGEHQSVDASQEGKNSWEIGPKDLANLQNTLKCSMCAISVFSVGDTLFLRKSL